MSTTAVSAGAMNARSRALPRFAWSLLGFMLFVVLWGAVVRATGSGDGCGNKWPLCNGDFLPHHPKLTTLIEFLHRSQTGVLTAGFLALLGWVYYDTPPRHEARKAVVWATLFLIAEALLGAVLVLKHLVEHNTSTLRIVMQSVHFTNTMLLIASLALTAWFLRSRELRTRLTNQPPAGRPIAVLALATTLLVGATGSLAALADTLFPSTTLSAAIAQDFAASSPLLIRMRWLHPASALISFVCVVLLLRASAFLRKPILALIAAQIVLGTADVLLLAPIWLQLLHLLTADLYWIALVVLAAQTLWPASAPALAEMPAPTQTIARAPGTLDHVRGRS